MLAACRRGLDVLDEHRLTLGASELRAQASVHGAELAALAQRHAARAGRPRLLLAWSERWRATAQAVPAVRPVADPDLSVSLTALRSVTRRLEEARSEGRPSASLQREQQRLESAVRASALRVQGAARHDPHRVQRPRTCSAELGPAQLIEIVDVDGGLQVLLCGAGRVRQFTAGRAADAMKAADFARFALRRLARRRPGDDPASALADPGDRRDPDSSPRCSARPSGIWATGPSSSSRPRRLHPIPWALLPALRDRVVSVAPSAGAWMRARSAPHPEHRHVTLARGPGLASDGAEIPDWSRRCTTTSPCWPTARPRPRRCCTRSTAPGWRTSPRTGRSAPTARCSPRCTCTTGR